MCWPFLPAGRAAAAVTDLQRQKAELDRKALQAERDALMQKSLAERAAARLREVGEQIEGLSSAVELTEGTIGETQASIASANEEVSLLRSDIGRLSAQQDALVRQLYIARVSLPDSLAFFSSGSVSDRERSEAQLSALERAVLLLAAQTRARSSQLESQLASLERRRRDLEGLRDQQAEQVRGLAAVKSQQADLRENAQAAEARLEAQAQQARVQSDKIEEQIAAELAAIVAARARASKSAGAAPSDGAGNGQRVAAGALVGHEGSTGNSTGPHVHFECRSGGAAVDCAPYVGSGTLDYPLKKFVVTQRFGETANSELYRGAPHMGTDIAGPYGAPVYAPAEGTVILNKWYGGYGYAWAEQLDNGLVVLLGHMTGK